MKEQLKLSDDLMNDLQQVLSSFNSLFAEFESDRVNTVPFEGSWTPAQVAQHVCMSATGFALVMNGPVKDTDRDPAEKAGMIKDIFLNFDIKMKSPDFVLPEDKEYNRDEMLTGLEQMREKVLHAAQTLDMSQLCVSFELPQLGHLTRLEAICFILYHTQRHLRQLGNMVLVGSGE